MSDKRRGSIGGVTIGNAWMYNNPCLRYPDGHESMDEDELAEALMEDFDKLESFDDEIKE